MDTTEGLGRHAGLAISANGVAHICYHDSGNDDLIHIYGEAPPTVRVTGEFDEDALVLSWSVVPNTTEYWIYGASNLPWFVPGNAPGYEHRVAIVVPSTTTWSSPNGIGDPNSNWTYVVMAVDETEAEITRSNRVGEWDWGIESRMSNPTTLR